jgi:CheY-like chemotaxis protein
MESKLNEAPTMAPPGEAPRCPDREKLGALTYLVVDDDDDMRILLKNFLQMYGISNVLEAEGAGHALKLLQTHMIDVLITDLIMPDMNGGDLVWCLRRSDNEHLRRLPVVMISAYDSKAHVDMSRDAGVDEFVTKPCSMSDLYLHVRRAVVAPRPFVVAPDYIGPDRRRKDRGAPLGRERRGIKIG